MSERRMYDVLARTHLDWANDDLPSHINQALPTQRKAALAAVRADVLMWIADDVKLDPRRLVVTIEMLNTPTGWPLVTIIGSPRQIQKVDARWDLESEGSFDATK